MLENAQFDGKQSKTFLVGWNWKQRNIYKGSLVTKKKGNVVLRKMMLKKAQPSQKVAKPL